MSAVCEITVGPLWGTGRKKDRSEGSPAQNLREVFLWSESAVPRASIWRGASEVTFQRYSWNVLDHHCSNSLIPLTCMPPRWRAVHATIWMEWAEN